MTTKTKPHPAPKPARGKLPRARVGYSNYRDGDPLRAWDIPYEFPCDQFPVAVLPCRTLKQARALVKLHGMSKRELVDRCVKYVGNWEGGGGSHYDTIEEVLAALGLGGGKS